MWGSLLFYTFTKSETKILFIFSSGRLPLSVSRPQQKPTNMFNNRPAAWCIRKHLSDALMDVYSGRLENHPSECTPAPAGYWRVSQCSQLLHSDLFCVRDQNLSALSQNEIQYIFPPSQSVGEINFDIHRGDRDQTQVERRSNGPAKWTGSFLHPCDR